MKCQASEGTIDTPDEIAVVPKVAIVENVVIAPIIFRYLYLVRKKLISIFFLNTHLSSVIQNSNNSVNR
jgi:hypothetical protein